MAFKGIHWDDLTSVGAAPVFDVELNDLFFYLQQNCARTFIAQKVDSFNTPNRNAFELPWCGPYLQKDANSIINWFIRLVGYKVSEEYGLLVAWRDEFPGNVYMASCLCLMDVPSDSSLNQKPSWFQPDRPMPGLIKTRYERIQE
jgi:hypothetical protein